MVAQTDPTTPHINEVVASTQEQLAERRKLVEAKRLAEATEEQASTAQELVQNTE